MCSAYALIFAKTARRWLSPDIFKKYAGVMELADVTDSKSVDGDIVGFESHHRHQAEPGTQFAFQGPAFSFALPPGFIGNICFAGAL